MSTIERISGAVLPYCRWRFAGGAQQPALGCEWASLQVQSLQPDSLVEGLGRWAPGEAKFSTPAASYCRRHRGGLSGRSPRKMARKRMRKTKSFDNRRHANAKPETQHNAAARMSSASYNNHTMNSNARRRGGSVCLGLVRSHLTHTSLESLTGLCRL
jgi:hypothetical protein